MLQLSQDEQHRYQRLFKRIEEHRLARIGLIQQLEELDAQARVTQLEFNALHNSFAPIAALPDEVLAMVFEAGTCLKQETELHFAIRVSHVTRSWRNIALATPRLWATIWCVKSKDMEGKPYPETIKERTTACLARSRSSPVEIYIRHGFTAEDQQFLQLIGNHFGRCQHFSMAGMSRADLLAVIIHFSRQTAPLLESFEFGPSRRGGFLRLRESLFPSGVPQLTTAQIGMLNHHTFHFCLPALQSVTSLRLTSLHSDNAIYASLREGLMALPSLVHLELHESYVRVHLPCLPVVLPALQVLHISSRNHDYGFLHFLGPCIHAASLTVLALQGNEPVNWAPDVNVHFPSLRHLILKSVPGFGILSLFPSIQRLTCQAPASWSGVDNSLHVGITDVLAALGPGPREDGDTGYRIPCPQLHTVAVSAAYWKLDVVAFTAQLSTLQDNGIPIRKLMLPKISFAQPDVDPEVMAELRAVVEIEDFRVDWATPFAGERFTEL